MGRTPERREVELAYLAGFFDGEGSIGASVSGPTDGRYAHRYPIVRIQITQKGRDLLDELVAVLGYGRINARQQGCYALVVNRQADVLRFIEEVGPYSRGNKRVQLDVAKALVEAIRRREPVEELDRLKDRLRELKGPSPSGPPPVPSLAV